MGRYCTWLGWLKIPKDASILVSLPSHQHTFFYFLVFVTLKNDALSSFQLSFLFSFVIFLCFCRPHFYFLKYVILYSCPSCFLCELCSILASFFPLQFCESTTLILTEYCYCFCFLDIWTSSLWNVNTGRIIICLILSNLSLLHPFSYMFLVLLSFRQHFLPLLKFPLLKSCIYVVATSCPSLWSLLFRSFLAPHLKLHPF